MELGDTRKRKQPNIMVALAPLITVIVLLVCCQLFLNIEIHFPLLLGTIVGALIGVFYLKYPWHEIEKGIFDSIYSAMQPILITGIIGFIIGAWISGGIVPAIVYYGLKVLSPDFFLVTSMVICSLVSVATGQFLDNSRNCRAGIGWMLVPVWGFRHPWWRVRSFPVLTLGIKCLHFPKQQIWHLPLLALHCLIIFDIWHIQQVQVMYWL